MKYITSAFLFGDASVIIVLNAIFTISLNPFRAPLICKTMLFKSTIVAKYSGSISAETDSFSRFLDNLVLLLFRKEPSTVDRDYGPCPKRSRKTPFISSFFCERATSVMREYKNMSASRIIPFSVEVFNFTFFFWNVLSFMFESAAKNEL